MCTRIDTQYRYACIVLRHSKAKMFTMPYSSSESFVTFQFARIRQCSSYRTQWVHHSGTQKPFNKHNAHKWRAFIVHRHGIRLPLSHDVWYRIRHMCQWLCYASVEYYNNTISTTYFIVWTKLYWFQINTTFTFNWCVRICVRLKTWKNKFEDCIFNIFNRCSAHVRGVGGGVLLFFPPEKIPFRCSSLSSIHLLSLATQTKSAIRYILPKARHNDAKFTLSKPITHDKAHAIHIN